jgi:hypothetical protein
LRIRVGLRRKSRNIQACSKSRHKNLMCHYCKKKGHIKTNCFKLKKKQKADKGVTLEEANVVDGDMIDTLCVVDGSVNDENS